MTAGAPPDMYSEKGQNWGFPLYNWAAMEQQGYSWWQQRLEVASQYYHLYRLDHIVGFFRIWGIPHGLEAKAGSFIPLDKSPSKAIWVAHGRKILQMMLNFCSMLPIGEDLGTIPPEVRVCMREMGICGTKVMRWERWWDEDRRFLKPEEYIPESMTTVSTHDSEIVELWWQNNRDEARLYSAFKGWEYFEQLPDAQKKSILWDSHHTSSLFHINLLQEYLSLFPEMAWPNREDERINFPGLVSDKNWTYRFRPSIEKIIADKPLADMMRELIAPAD